MADKKLRRCTGSSLNLRAQMDQNYVIVHDVSSNVSFEKYIQFARGCFDQAVKLYNKKDYQRAYVDFTKFHQFVKDKLPSHQNYNNGRAEVAKIWLAQADEACTQFLEEISFQLDTMEDEKLNPNSRSPFLVEMQKHKVDIFVPEWIDVDSDDEEGTAARAHANHRMHGELHLRHNTEQHRPNFHQQHVAAPPQHLPHSHSTSELPPPRAHAPLHRVTHSDPRDYKSHTESQDLAQAIQESLMSAQSPPFDAYFHAQQQHTQHSPFRESYEHRAHYARAELHAEQIQLLHHHHSVGSGHYTHSDASYEHRHQYSSHTTSHSSSLPFYVAPGLTQDDAAILRYCKAYTT